MGNFKVNDIVQELYEFTLGLVIRVDYEAGFDKVWVSFDSYMTEHCYVTEDLKLVAKAENREDM